jgi:dihydroxy-acid dehydratase
MSDIGAFNKFELLSNKTCYKACGYTDDDLDRPIIGIANSYNEMVSGHMNLRALAEQVKYGVYRAGGTPVEFGVIACCDGITDNHKGAYYVLPPGRILPTPWRYRPAPTSWTDWCCWQAATR